MKRLIPLVGVVILSAVLTLSFGANSARAQQNVPYAEKDVTFKNGDISLSGTLSLPTGNGPFPAVILISGSGPSDRDESLKPIAEIQPFRLLADHLTRHGIAVLRYDDRGVGKSTGVNATATSADFATDAEAALTFLQVQPEINPKFIGLLGHSEGGLIAAMIAARNPNVAFVISMAGPAVNGYDLLLKQEARIQAASGLTKEQIEQNSAITRKMLDLTKAQDWAALEKFVLDTVTSQLQALPEAQRKAIGDLNAYAQKVTAEQMVQLKGWMYFFVTYDPMKDWERIRIPVLGLFGDLDMQVDADQNAPALEAALKRAGNLDFSVVRFAKANHLFQEATTGHPMEYAALKAEFLPDFLPTITNWVLERVKVLAI